MALSIWVPSVLAISEWPYQQISGWEGSVQNFCKDLYRTAVYLNPARKDYLRLYRAHRILNPHDNFNLLYMQATETDHAYAFAAGQLELAMKCADKAKKEEKNAARRRVIPRSINKDGSLAMVHPHDWCSGFFAGIEGESYDLGVVGHTVVVGSGCFFFALRTGEHPVGQFGKPFLQLFAVLGSKCF